MTEVTKNIILDLLPLYIGGEASEDTAHLVRQYLETDPELAELARQMEKSNAQNAAPALRSKEAEMEGFEKTKQLLVIRSTIVVSLVAMFLCAAMFFIPAVILMFQR
jgi:anti-sigma factor RsiW